MNCEKDPSKSLFFISENVQNNLLKRRGIACAVYFKGQLFLLTSSSAISSKGNPKKLLAEQFSPEQFGDYRLEVSLFSKLGSFTLLKIDKGNENGEKGSGCVSGLNPESPSPERKRSASPFCGKQSFEIELKCHGNNTNIEVISGEAKITSILGAPIIVENEHTNTTQSGIFSVIGVVGLTGEKKLCPCYLDENTLEMLFCEQEEGNGATDIQRPVEQDTVPDSGQTTISVDVAASQGATKIKGSDEEPGQATTSVDPLAFQDETDIKKSVQETSASGPAIPHNGLPHHFEKGTPWALADRNFMKFPPLTSSFIGRENVVKEIVSKFTRKADPLRMAVILSIPGAGKTQTAIKVGHDLLNCNRSVIFIDKQESLTELCDEIIYEICGQYLSESQDLVCRAKKRLKALESDVVIILDNTEDVQGKEGMEFDNFVKYVVEKAPSIQLIITTQKDIGFTSLNVHKERLEPLDSHSCALLLRESVDITEKNAQEIGKLCGGIPLFLVNCVALLQTSFSVDALIRLLKENPIELLENSVQNVYDALGLFLRNMSNPLLKHLVQVSVFPSSFSANYFRQVLFDGNELKSESVRSQMVGLSLLQRMRDEKYALHPLVREYCRARREILKMVVVGKSAQGKFNAYFIEKLRTLSKDFITRNSAMVAISSFREDKANIMEALRNHLDDKSSAQEKAFGVDVAISTEVLDFLSKVLSPPAECLKFYQICYGIAEDSGDQRRLADSLTALGFCHLCDAAHLRHNPQSLDNLERAKEISEKLSKEQQNCQAHALIQCKLGLCFCLKGQGKDKGLNLIREGIELKKKLRDPLYLAAGHCDLGNAYCILGDHQKAIDIWEKETFPIYQNQLGEHPWTATILHFIAVSYTAQAQRNVDVAVKKSRDALKMRKKLLGFHQETARSHVLLSDALELQNDFKSALEELEEALKIQKEVLGENHNSTKDTQAKMRRIKIAIMQDSNGKV
ncbi:uncharacterized protein LOC114954056 isoform X2 [Acropora millepora]|nr:uncharacterized protein LOC114954056 isoform X2 [Acropora millepora]